MLGLTPSIFFRVDAPNTCKQVSLATPEIFIEMVFAEDDKNKRVRVTFLSDLKKTKRKATNKKSRCHFGATR